MALLQMSFENYRCFKERQVVDLRPITVILGKNNSGKSAVTRLPLLLETGIHTQSPLPLNLDSLGSDPPDYLDLVYERNVHRQLRFGLTTGNEDMSLDLKATIQNISEQHTQFISALEFNNGSRSGKIEWIPGGTESPYSVTLVQQYHFEGDVQFSGMLPLAGLFQGTLFDDFALDTFDSLSLVALSSFPDISYLGPYRRRPSRLTRLPSRTPDEVGTEGENTVGILLNDHVRGGRVLIDQVNRLLGNSLDGWRVEVEVQGPLYSVNLRSTTNPALTVNLLDSGTGIAQVLPFFVQQAQSMIPQGHRRDHLQVIEEPELHLHPSFHALLADIFIEGHRAGGRFLIETHSETMLLRLRRRVAEGEISPEDIALYFVDHASGTSRVHRIGIDELGNLDYWPSGVFSEDFEETKKLAEAQFARERDETR